MKRTLLLVSIAGLMTTHLCAASMELKDITTDPDSHYLKESEAVNSQKLLPPPPAIDSVQFVNDQAQYEMGRLQRDTPRGKQAFEDADQSGGISLAKTFSAAYGMTISEANTPELLTKMRGDVGDMATRIAKNHYMRLRPYVFHQTGTCKAADEARERNRGSYPSSHTSTGWGIALILTEINPERREELLQRGLEVGQSRVVCGYHWQSDVDAGRTMGAAQLAVLHANPQFQQQLQKAKAEFAKLKNR